jgi:hypothetical protein
MEDQVTSSKASAEQPKAETTSEVLVEQDKTASTITSSTEIAGTEHRQSYGTAKTENLRDSGLWRILLPGFILLCCLIILAVPLIILVDLLYGAIVGTGSADVVAIHHQLIWVWIVMIVLELGVAAVIIRYFFKTFLSSTAGYSKS